MTPLHTIGDFVREILLGIPLPAVRILFILVPLLLLVWVVLLPRDQVAPPGEKKSLGGNLRIWAALALLFQILLYLVL